MLWKELKWSQLNTLRNKKKYAIAADLNFLLAKLRLAENWILASRTLINLLPNI